MTPPADAAAAAVPGAAAVLPRAPADGRRGAWSTLAHAAPLFTVAVVANAVVQAVLVTFAPDVALSPLGVLLAVLSAGSLLAASVLLWRSAASAAGGGSLGGLIARCLVVGALAVLAAIVFPAVLPIVLALGCIPLAAGGLHASGALIARHPFRLVGLALVTAIVVVLLELAALLLGFFLTGWPASAATWLATGVTAAILIAHWQALAVRSSPGRDELR